jgi:hypothetical protein
MKSLRLLIAVVVVIVLDGCVHQRTLNHADVDLLVSQSKALSEVRNRWLEDRPRKLSWMNLAGDSLPLPLRNHGFTDATVDAGYVVLFTGTRSGVLVITDPRMELPILHDLGVRMENTPYQEIKNLTAVR